MARPARCFKSRIGFMPCETKIDSSVCAHVLVEPHLLVIPNLAKDLRSAIDSFGVRERGPLTTMRQASRRLRARRGTSMVASQLSHCWRSSTPVGSQRSDARNQSCGGSIDAIVKARTRNNIRIVQKRACLESAMGQSTADDHQPLGAKIRHWLRCRNWTFLLRSSAANDCGSGSVVHVGVALPIVAPGADELFQILFRASDCRPVFRKRLRVEGWIDTGIHQPMWAGE